jgi:hypothetical protein
VEGALLSTALEELATVLYKIGQAFESTDESCTRGLQSCIVIGNQIETDAEYDGETRAAKLQQAVHPH